MKKNYLYKKIFGLLIVVLLTVSCSGFLTAVGNPDPRLAETIRKGCISSGAFGSYIDGKVVPTGVVSDQDSREVFSNYTAGAELVARYVRRGATGDGSSPARASRNLKTVLDGITNAAADKVYVVLIDPGTYDAGAEMSMKNNVAIVGYCPGALEGDKTIVLSGGGSRRVFNNSGLDETASLHGVTIAYGKGDNGGGMLVSKSSLRLNRVVFSGNNAASSGGGLHVSDSSPLLTEVTFSGNAAAKYGGGLWVGRGNPILIGVTFSGNRTTDYGYGAGMYNGGTTVITDALFSGNLGDPRGSSGGGLHNSHNSEVRLTKVTFSRNSAVTRGGGIATDSAYNTLKMETVVFVNNISKGYGGGMWVHQANVKMNSATFMGNRSLCGGGGIFAKGSTVDILNTVIWHNSNDIRTTVAGGDQVLILPEEAPFTCIGCDENVTSGSFLKGLKQMADRGVVIHSSLVLDVTTNSVDPGLLSFSYYGSRGLAEGAIPTSSAAVNKGLYMRKAVVRLQTIYYYSADNTTWYRDPGLSVADTLPANTVDLTATDITGAPRIGRPDLGAFEAR